MNKELAELKKHIEELKAKDNGVCPHCGHCKHCGHGGAVPVYPLYPVYPQPWYPWWGQIWCGGTITTSGNVQLTGNTTYLDSSAQISFTQ